MPDSPIKEKFRQESEDAIRGENLSSDLFRIALQMRIHGLAQQEAMEIICAAEESVIGKYFGDDPRDDLIADILDMVVGWCNSACHIWDCDYDAAKKLEESEQWERNQAS